MAPDKIYVDKFGQSIEGYIPEGCSLVTEYIRKDALLEWAKKEIKEWSSESNTAQGIKMGLTLVLDKIESL